MAEVNYTITRTALTPGALTVRVVIGGTAVFNTDYGYVSGADSFAANEAIITIPNGQLSKTITIASLNSVLTVAKTVIFTIVNEPEYIGIEPAVQTLTINVLPVGDILAQISVQPLFAYSIARRLNPSYTGAAYEVQKITAGVLGAVMDVGFLNNGLTNTPSMLAFLGSSTGRITKVYNQGSGGSAYPATATSVNAASVLTSSSAAINGILQTKQGRHMARQRPDGAFVIPHAALMSFGQQQYTINYVGGWAGTYDGINPGTNRVVFTGGLTDSSAFTLGIFAQNNGANPRYRSFRANNIGNHTIAPAVVPPAGDTNLKIYSVRSNINPTLNAFVYENLIDYSTANMPTYLPPTSLRTNGYSVSGEGSDSWFAECVIWGQAISVAQLQVLENSQKIFYSVV